MTSGDGGGSSAARDRPAAVGELVPWHGLAVELAELLEEMDKDERRRLVFELGLALAPADGHCELWREAHRRDPHVVALAMSHLLAVSVPFNARQERAVFRDPQTDTNLHTGALVGL
jgi:hypothetical protein